MNTHSKCTQCNEPLSINQRICGRCGAKVAAPQQLRPSVPSATFSSSHFGSTISPPQYKLQPAGFWRRVAAFAVDLLILVPLALISQTFLPLIGGLFIWWLYFTIFECSGWHATPGKRVLGLQVTDVNGVHLRKGRAALRFGAKLLSAAPLFAGFLLAAWTQNKQALHDLIANTLVIKSH